MICLSHPIVCIVGPTASGKTDLAEAYAEDIDGCIVSADSMQIYIGMDIGTGKIPSSSRRVQYYGLDLIEPNQAYSAALFQTYARSAFQEIDSRGKPVILTGGTGFYVRAAIDDYDFPKGVQQNNPIREKYESFLKVHGSEALWELLNEIDLQSAEAIHPNNTKRVIRALEMLEEGKNYSQLAQNFSSIEQLYEAIFIGLDVDREKLNSRINSRVDSMISSGLVGEVQRLLDKGFGDSLTASQAIGYKEIIDALEGKISLDKAVEDIKQATRRYAKRQRTWFRRDSRIRWIDANSANTEELLDKVKEIVEQERIGR